MSPRHRSNPAATPTPDTDPLTAALAYARRGWPVFPVGVAAHDLGENYPKGSDVPPKGWEVRATTDPDEITEWWSKARQGPFTAVNVAIRCGPGADLLVLDIDPRNGGDETFARLERDLGPLPGTPTVRTGGGGRHYYLRWVDALGGKAKGILGPGVDVQAGTAEKGAFVYAPPSIRAKHDAPYDWLDPDTEMAELPGPWLEALRIRGRETSGGALQLPDRIPKGTRDDTLFRYGCALRARGVDEAEIEARLEEANRERCDPPVPARQLVKLQEQVLKYDPPPAALDDFLAYVQSSKFIFVPTGDLWIGTHIDARVPSVQERGPDGEIQKVSATRWLRRERSVEGMTWDPAETRVIEDQLILLGGYVPRPGARVFNLYLPPSVSPGDPEGAGPWLGLLRRLFPDAWEHLVRWFAHRVQRPGEKVNHALLLLGTQGIGKDSALEPVVRAVGPWNAQEVSPGELMGDFNDFYQAVLLRVSEARDEGEVNRWQLYERTKTLCAAPPEMIRVNVKYVPQYLVRNVVGTVWTSNDVVAPIFLPPGDRRWFVARSELVQNDFGATEEARTGFWRDLWTWYQRQGFRDVAAYLRQPGLLEGFDPKAPPPKTTAFYEIVDANRPQSHGSLADALEILDEPDALVLAQLISACDDPELQTQITDPKHALKVKRWLDELGYVKCDNPNAKSGRWRVAGTQVTIYVRRDLPPGRRVDAAEALVEDARKNPGTYRTSF